MLNPVEPKESGMKRSGLGLGTAVAASVALATGLGTTSATSAAATAATTGLATQARPVFKLVNVAPQDGGGEPSLTTGPRNGYLYVTYPASSGTPFYYSPNEGASWQKGATAESGSGDDCVSTDQSGAVYLCNLSETSDSIPLQADVFKSLDNGRHWARSTGTIPGGGDSSQPFFVDRPWLDAYVPSRKTTTQAEVVLEYHDFGPSQIWVNVSKNGGKTFGAPVDVLAGSPQAEEASFCNTVPAGVKIVKSGAHLGRIYVAWITADAPSSIATGCNLSQLDTFHQIWVAWSDNGGSTWTSHVVFDGGLGHDTSTPFVGFTLDRAGNPYVAFADNLGTQYDMYVEASFDGGLKWNGSSTGAGAPYLVSGSKGTHFYPAIAAGAPGHVDVAYLATPTVIKTLPTGKEEFGGGAGASWYLYSAQSTNVGQSSHPAWTITRATPTPMHVGDICNLGIFCVSQLGSNRDLLDFISTSIGANGLQHIVFTDDNHMHEILMANEISGQSAF